MSTDLAEPAMRDTTHPVDPGPPDVDVVVPVYDEEADLGPSVRRLHAYLSHGFPFSWRITIADNASRDLTPVVAAGLAEDLPGVRVVRLEEKGRGRALRAAWSASDAKVLAYMDVDLSTDLDALLPLVAPLLSGHSDVAIGSRLAPSARVVRGPKRELVSRGYNRLLRLALRVGFSDAQCGFKAVRADRARALLPLVRDTGWFFDTELLVLAERTGLRIHEVPVDWVDDPDSRVDIVATAIADLRGITRLARDLATGRLPVARLRAEFREPSVSAGSSFVGQVLRFGVVGVVSTLAYLALYLVLRLAVPAVPANALALLLTALGNTAANRRFTFEVAGREGAVRHHLHGLALFLAGLALSSGALTALHATNPEPPRALEIGVLVTANLVTTALRFVAMRWWVFAPAVRPGRRPGGRSMTSLPYPRVAGSPQAPAAEAVAAAVPDAIRAATDRGGERARPRWERPALAGLLGVTALLYLWGLGASGWANAFYSAAVQAASQSWEAFFFGSFDASNAITVDKPPAALWVMGLSARIFGVNAWSILVPEALMGVATVGLLYATVRRRFGAAAGLLAGAVAALTPVAVLMFRFNNPDPLLVLLLVAAAWALTRALEGASTRWLLLVGAFVGFAFLAKMLQAFLVVPGFALVYLLAAPTSLRRRVVQLLAAGASMLVSAGWWVAVVELWPASSRPYIGGSQTNSVLELVLGYNGLGRLTGDETGSVVGGGQQGQAGQWGETGLFRLFQAEMGGQASWLIPAALLFTGYLLWTARRAPRTDGRRAQVLLWASWLVVTGLTFSFGQGIIHPYYTVALAPAIGALVGIGAVSAWRCARLPQTQVPARVTLAVAFVVTGIWAAVLLARSSDFVPWLRPLVIVAAVAAAVGVVVPLLTPVTGGIMRRLAPAVAGLAVFSAFAGPTAYALETASTPHTGALPSAGPRVAGGFGPGGGLGRRFGAAPPGATGTFPGFPGTQGGTQGGAGGGFGPGGQGGLGGLLDASTPDSALVELVAADTTTRWAAAAVGSNSAAGVQLASGRPVMAIGGFNGSDPSPTLEQFKAYVAAGQVHYFLAGASGGGRAGFGPGAGSGASSTIATWVEQTFTSTTVGGVTVYDLTQPPSGSSTT